MTRDLAVGILVAGAAVGLASPASAEPIGSYTATVTTGNPTIDLKVGDVVAVSFTPCGPGCAHLQIGRQDSFQSDLRLHGEKWVGSRASSTGEHICTYTMDIDVSVLTSDCPGYRSAIVYALEKNI
jgi:hypothetical protein